MGQRGVQPAVRLGESHELPHGCGPGWHAQRQSGAVPQSTRGLSVSPASGQPGYACTSGLHAEVVRFGTGTARIGAAARQQGLGLAVLAQPQGHPTAGAVGGQATGGLGTRGLGQVKSPCGPMQGPPMHNQPHMSLHLLYRERDETARGHEGAHWSGRQEG